MITLTLKGEEDFYRSVYRLEKNVADSSGEFVLKMGERLVEYIRESWSKNSPSSAGNPPAIESGNLDSSIQMESTGRDASGRFANSDNLKVVFVRADTTKGTITDASGRDPNDKPNWAQSQELGQAGHHLPRPFMAPALEKIALEFGREAKLNIHARP